MQINEVPVVRAVQMVACLLAALLSGCGEPSVPRRDGALADGSGDLQVQAPRWDASLPDRFARDGTVRDGWSPDAGASDLMPAVDAPAQTDASTSVDSRPADAGLPPDERCAPDPVVSLDAPLSPTQAREANKFVESVGVVLPLNRGIYRSKFASVVKPRIAEIGIRFTRGSIEGAVDAESRAMLRQLNEEHGIRFILMVPKSVSATAARDAVKALGPARVVGVEGINEPENKFGSGNAWVGPTRDHQQALFAAFKADPETRGVLILGPSLKGVEPESPGKLGSLNAYLDANNIHRYPGVGNPPEPMAGMRKNMGPVLTVVGSPSKPTFITETGYPTQTGGSPESEEAIYMPRLYLHTFAHGVARTHKYEFLNESGTAGDREGNFGYIRFDNTPKPSFHAVKNLITLLADRGARFVPRPLAYTLSGATADVHRVLLQKRDGVFYLALWLGKAIAAASPQAVVLELPESIASAATARPNDGVTWSLAPIAAHKVNLSIDGKVLLVKLTPRGASAPPTCRP